MQKLNVIPYPNKVEFTQGTVKKETLVGNTKLTVTPGSMGDEAYRLEITPDGASAFAATEKGAFYAGKTLEQLLDGDEIPCCVIEDEPAFSYRGFMIDTVRHIVSLEDTKKLIDAAAGVKMNAMHWHLSDDQGWRVQIDKRPLLSEKASVRKASMFGREREQEEYGGFFTKEELKEIVEYAKQRYIEVIPEIDVPGHTTAVLHAYPELGCTGKEVEVAVKQGIYPTVLCAGNDEALALVYDVIDELVEIFPSPYFHIGGDEVPKTAWAACEKCRARKKENGLKSDDELQTWFSNKVAQHLKEKGKTAVVWNDTIKGGTVDGATVQFWMKGKKRTAKYANEGGRVIVSDFFAYYTDYNYAITPLKKTYNYNPFIKGLKSEGRINIAGVETPTWTEYITNFERYCYLAFPRCTAVAETGWTLPENKDEEDFERRFEIYRKRLENLGITPAQKDEWAVPFLKRFTQAKLY